MSSLNQSPDSPNDSAAIQNGDKEESCILIEENISIIEIDETIKTQDEDEESSLNNNSDELIEDPPDCLPSEFQVIDEVGGSQEIQEEQQEEGGELNGVRIKASLSTSITIAKMSFFLG
jgi:hypothetical protein